MYKENKVIMIAYQKAPKDVFSIPEKLSLKQVQYLLKNNYNKGWRKGDPTIFGKTWYANGNKMVAEYNLQDNSLMITMLDYIDLSIKLYIKPQEQKETYIKPQNNTINISYDQVLERLNKFFVIKQESNVSGEKRYIGKASKGTAILEIIGNKDNITQTSLTVGFPSDSNEILIQNTAILLRFMTNIAPEWKQGSTWATRSIKQASLSDKKQTIIKGNKFIELFLLKQLGMVCIAVKNKNYSESN